MPSRHLVILARTNAAAGERAAEILSELDEWFEISPSTDGRPADGFASVDVGGHIFDLEEAGQQVIARLDEIDANWRKSLRVVHSELG